MKTQTYLLIGGLLLAPVANGFSTEYVGSDEWQLRRLFEPTKGELNQESKGRVVIYDGLKAEEVERAMEQQFDRIDSMMFIHIKKRKPSGEVVAYDDSGC